MRGQSLKQWFYLNARLPLFFSVLVFFVFEILLLAIIGKNQLEHQTGVSARLAELTKIALLQKSSSLLQAGVDLAVRDLRAHRAFLCESSRVYATPSLEMSPCSVEQMRGYRILEVPIVFDEAPLHRSYQFVLQVPIWPKENVLLLILGISVLMSVLGVWLLARVRSRLEKDLFEPLFKNLSKNIVLPIRELEELRKNLLQLSHLRTQEAVSRAVLERSAQVAHDIKSPLTALMFASSDFELLPSSSKNVIRSAVNRISAIAESLVEKRSEGQGNSNTGLKSVLIELVEEKKAEYSSLSELIWVLELEGLSFDVRVPLREQELKRVLSNLINNSVEAMDGMGGKLCVGAQSSQERIEMWVQDAGKGVPGSLLSRLGERGFSFGKKEGRGLGLSYAKETIEKNGGVFHINSKEKLGCRVVLSFPRGS
ncbi:MAG: sensor histidine kinase [Proteobacteria bacterium]|nr:sensor histidine kinase [Pseudomonadota bacterium]